MQPHSASCRWQFPVDLSGIVAINDALSPAPRARPSLGQPLKGSRADGRRTSVVSRYFGVGGERRA